MDAIQLFLLEHARAHSAAMAMVEGEMRLEDVVFGGLTDDQLRQRPQEGQISLAWLLWHVTRIEDVAMNLVLSGRSQVRDEEDWLDQLGIARRGVGTGMNDSEVTDFSQRVNIAELRAYRAAVGRRTQEVVAKLSPTDLAERIDALQVARAMAAGAFGEEAGSLPQFWEGKPKAWYLSWTGAAHCYNHLGEAMCVKSLAGFTPGR